jgi:geranylgeranyl pyrophosphate synthase
MMIFRIRGKEYDIAEKNIKEVLEKLEPEPLKGRAKYYIEYKEKRYRIKQVIAAVTGLPRVEFTTRAAYRILTKLGFEVKELGKHKI